MKITDVIKSENIGKKFDVIEAGVVIDCITLDDTMTPVCVDDEMFEEEYFESLYSLTDIVGFQYRLKS